MTASRCNRAWALVVVVAAGCGQAPVAHLPPARPIILPVDELPTSLDFAPDGRSLAGGLVLRGLPAGAVLAQGKLGEEYPPCTGAAFAPDGKRLASVHFDNGYVRARHAVCLWEVGAGRELRRSAILFLDKDQRSQYEEALHSPVFSPDGSLLAIRHANDSTSVWETATGKERLRLKTDGLAVAFTSDGRSLVSVSRTGQVSRWNTSTGQQSDAGEANGRDFLYVRQAVASADGTTLALTDGYTVALKDARTGKRRCRLEVGQVSSLALSPAGGCLAVGREDAVILFDTTTGREIGWWSESETRVPALAFSRDGKSLALAKNGRSSSQIQVWDVADLLRQRRPEAQPRPATGLEAKLVSRKESYPLELGGKTPLEFARQFRVYQKRPALPAVDFVLLLKNTGKTPILLDPEGTLDFYLVGDGAVNHPELLRQTGFRLPGPEPRKISLAPGESHAIPLRSLDGGDDRESWWLLPGEYTLHVSYQARFQRALDGGSKEEAWENADLESSLRVKVVKKRNRDPLNDAIQLFSSIRTAAPNRSCSARRPAARMGLSRNSSRSSGGSQAEAASAFAPVEPIRQPRNRRERTRPRWGDSASTCAP
jgi:WD40 repeat protein